jgi:adenylate cyclase
MKRYIAILPPLIIFLVLQLLFLADFWDILEHKVTDQYFRQRGPVKPSGDVVVVAIDDDTFASIDEPWPFPRWYHAHLIDNLERAGARQIVFDIEFIENREPEFDSLLAATAACYGNVVFDGKISKEETATQVSERLLTPIEPIMKLHQPWGLVNMKADPDGFVRSYTLYQTFRDQPYYSIGVVSAALDGDDWATLPDRVKNQRRQLRIQPSGKNIVVPKYTGDTALINFLGPEKTFPTYSYSSVLDDSTFIMPMGDFDEFEQLNEMGVFRDKIVLVGASAAEMHDLFSTPFLKDFTPGVEVHANFIEMTRRQLFLRQIPYLWLVLIQFLLTVGLFLLLRKVRPSISLIIALALIVGIFVINYELFARARWVVPSLQFVLLFVILYVSSLLSHYMRTAREKRFIRKAFAQYMSPQLVHNLLKNPKALEYGGEQRELTVLFSDIRGFTTYTEGHPPKDTVAILREYLTAMVDVIIKHNGVLDKFVGDEIMALFGAPVELPNHALAACRVALEMRVRLLELHAKWRSEGRDVFDIGIGVNTGCATVGNLGSEQIFDYTAIGDNINLGARLESINKEYPTEKHIIISESTLAMLGDLAEVRFLAEVNVKGKNIPVKIYELIDLKEN